MTHHTKIPAWFWVVTIIALLWNIMGVFSFFAHVFISDAALKALPAEEQAIYASYPMWTQIVFALSTFGGLFGCIALLLKKQIAARLFLISLLAILIQMTHSMFFTDAIEYYGPQSIIMPVLVIVIGIVLLWFSRFCTKKGILN